MRIVQEIVGKEVLDSSAVVIGKVKDLEVNFMTNEIEAFIVGKGGISEGLGLSKGETIVPYDMVSKIGDKILLKSRDEGTNYESNYEF
ncbi:PRC-barrel domain-containing protein [uncultured Methanobacterium sp.]|uniref:PRC-barrel domain-containing protein n=1 Tax=uncultured Methanobacterium sp. TaxID=176306 RepID=UPI002AA70486|nr:PRC-barrel domain-containing protein [uncultured Methanobacterium sp.]